MDQIRAQSMPWLEGKERELAMRELKAELYDDWEQRRIRRAELQRASENRGRLRRLVGKGKRSV